MLFVPRHSSGLLMDNVDTVRSVLLVLQGLDSSAMITAAASASPTRI